MDKCHEFYMPKESWFGHGCAQAIGGRLAEMGLGKALVVTDRFLYQEGRILGLVTEGLDRHKIHYTVFHQVSPNPTMEEVESGARQYERDGRDCIVAVGGGSPIDCAKAMGVWIAGGGNLKDYVGLDRCPLDCVPLVAVNTTAGTASEMSRACLILDQESRRKVAIKDKKAIPMLAVNDSRLMVSLPPSLTAATGMDALTHAIESYTATNAYPVSQASALEAACLVFENLEGACKEPNHIPWRDNMIYGEFLAGISFCNSGLGLVHAMSHQLSATYLLPHGLSNAVLLPHVMAFNQNHVPGIYDQLFFRIHWKDKEAEMAPGEPSWKLIGQVEDLSARIGTRQSLKSLGVEREDFEKMARHALLDGCYKTTPVKSGVDQVVEIFERAYW